MSRVLETEPHVATLADPPADAPALTLFGSSANGTVSRFELREVDSVTAVLSCSGVLSWSDREMLAATVEQCLRGRPTLRHVILDLTEVEFVSSAGVGGLFQLLQRTRACNATLALAGTQPAVVRVLSSVGLDRLVKTYPDVASAVRDVDPAPPGA